jgi:hypothetical protein
MASRWRPCAGLLALLLLAGCEWMSWPDPLDHEYHTHRLILHTAVIDSSHGHSYWPRDIGMALLRCEFRRPGSGYDNFRADYTTEPYVLLDSVADPDTVDTFSLVHFAGLAQHLGGDTTHFARMDSLPGWEWSYRVTAYVNGEGDGWEAEEEFLLTLPDTVAPEVHLRIEVTWPLLYEYDSRGHLRINLNYVRISRLDTN